ncbi:MAG: pyridoxine 5'-phosphate synthase, partial [Victivallaceae bacterium]|nr:pyridoxine 5'-phosphate synthase [Victivallaceae bacterium]
RLRETGIKVSLFIDPEEKQLDAASKMGSDYVELHTWAYPNATGAAQQRELARLKHAAAYGHNLGLSVNAGHGIDYENIKGILEVPYLSELNIGHCIVGRAIMVGMEQAVREMVAAMNSYQG